MIFLHEAESEFCGRSDVKVLRVPLLRKQNFIVNPPRLARIKGRTKQKQIHFLNA
ncbi:hypothetical protein LEP1GSC058_3945 [Leptospira fainei serovar Hurstbridge str. BUT 6]|uniref:Uncharacterized protein n=1 Tax=Leptospira fainei serovar Hurstbridge str. BUT 6 TaxID=1193011 RepID=S3VYQ1_9LEPT|nr:hypothetical protein LEP1GSC058_3945 [Leptospira fainei serovar Hurstbridge str. BUT 6]